jgi:hypothetical protein
LAGQPVAATTSAVARRTKWDQALQSSTLHRFLSIALQAKTQFLLKKCTNATVKSVLVATLFVAIWLPLRSCRINGGVAAFRVLG